jgi:hypothetical protein
MAWTKPKTDRTRRKSRSPKQQLHSKFLTSKGQIGLIKAIVNRLVLIAQLPPYQERALRISIDALDAYLMHQHNIERAKLAALEEAAHGKS